MSANPDLQQPTVVCVDGSPSGEDGLRWAARQACLTSAPLRAVIAWELPNTDGNDYGWAHRRWPISTLRGTRVGP
jgi:K+-sensing histidine kinase KdpD